MSLLLLVMALVLCPALATARTINVGPTDSYDKIEGALPGDTVLIAPGTYQFRVMLSQKGTAAAPIVIKAKDPANRPVWDLKGKAVRDWPGSYTAGDRGRGCWQVKGAHYVISGIVFRNCQDSSSAGIRTVNSGPVTVRDCLFDGNTNGITGSADEYLVEFCEFKNNGKLTSSGSPTHNIYIYGGKFTLRYSYLHDPLEGQNFHVRARDALIEYNWIARSASYPGDLMSCNTLCGGSGDAPITQRMLLRGNVIIQGQTSNLSQVIALYNDESSGSYDKSGKASALELTLINNTVIGTPVSAGKTQRLVNMRNDGVATKVVLHNNIVYQLRELAVPRTPGSSNWSISGSNNWVSSGAKASGVTGTLSGSTPGFVSAAGMDYQLTAASPCRGKAATVSGLPTREYYKDETTKLQYRSRPSARDLGAFEYGNTAPPVGANDPAPPLPDGGSAGDSGVGKDFGSDGGQDSSEDSGCGCAAGPGTAGSALWLFALLLMLRRRRG